MGLLREADMQTAADDPAAAGEPRISRVIGLKPFAPLQLAIIDYRVVGHFVDDAAGLIRVGALVRLAREEAMHLRLDSRPERAAQEWKAIIESAAGTDAIVVDVVRAAGLVWHGRGL